MPLFLGIDGGGSKTTCAVGDDARVLASATTGGSNVVRLGEAVARENLHGAITQACDRAGVSPGDIASGVMGVAGATVTSYREALQRLISELVPGRVEIVGDNVIAMESAFAGGPGVVVIAGTGSIAFGRNAKGETARAGGYGFEVSDEGSGHWIGRRAVAAALRAHDRGDDSLLGDILAAWTLPSLEDLVQVANGTPRPDFARLFPVVLDHPGEEPSRILDDAGRELAGLAAVPLDRLFRREALVPVALGGGVFAHSRRVRESFSATLNQARPNTPVKDGVIEPVMGALWLARRGAAAHD
jgi:glucosamine kinase